MYDYLEKRLARAEAHLEDAEAGLSRIREAADYAAEADPRSVVVRETDQGARLGDALFPRRADGVLVREAAASSPRSPGEQWGDQLFDHDWAHPPRPLSYQEHLTVEAAVRAAHRPSGPISPADQRLAEAWERMCGGQQA